MGELRKLSPPQTQGSVGHRISLTGAQELRSAEPTVSTRSYHPRNIGLVVWRNLKPFSAGKWVHACFRPSKPMTA